MQDSSLRSSKILPLPADVAAQISSSTIIPSLTSVILGLLENSLDAGAKNVDLHVDVRRASCAVEDDGCGIPANEFTEEGGLGKQFYTSKYNSPDDQYGRRGIFLSSVAALSILSITSREQNRISQSSLVLHHSRPAARFSKAPSHRALSTFGYGTRITVQDLFGNMPVRVKQRRSDHSPGTNSIDREFESLRKAIAALLISFHKPVHVFLNYVEGENRGLGRKLHIGLTPEANLTLSESRRPPISIQTPLICKILTHAGYIQPSEWDTWVKASARTVNIAIRGAISLQPAPSKTVQFMSLGIRPLDPESGHNTLYEEVNKIFALSSFGRQEVGIGTDDAEWKKDRRFKQDGFTAKQLRRRGKGPDRWPMFYIRIDLGDQNDTKRLEREATLNNVVTVLGAMIHGFLKDHHFRPRNVHRSSNRPSPIPPKKPITFDRTLSTEDAFSNWSRIKSSNRQGGGSSRPSEAVHKPDRELIKPVPIIESTVSPGTPKETLVNSNGEELIPWTNPVTKATVFINSRTDLVTSQTASDNRPSTAPAELQHRQGPPRISRVASKGFQTPQQGSWAEDFLSKWKNPVFAPPTEEPISQIIPNLDTFKSQCEPCSGTQASTFHLSTSTISTRLSKSDLLTARVIAQVDHKFILISITNSRVSNLLLLVDQHAADERIRVEALLHDFHTQPPLPTTKPLIFKIPPHEHGLFLEHQPTFAHWGITYTILPPKPSLPPPSSSHAPKLTIKTLPPTLSARLTASPPDLISLLRTTLHTLPSSSSSTPQAISDLLSSRACRSAIMFNDPLTLAECECLVRKLAYARWPWGCAHGRPSMVGVVEVGVGMGVALGRERDGEEEGKGEVGFGVAWRASRGFRGNDGGGEEG